MIRALLSVLLCSLLNLPVTALSAPQGADEPNPIKVVAAFQELPHYEMFCLDTTWGDWEPTKVGAKFETYLSKDMYKLFLWSQCRHPETPPFYGELHNLITWDIRFGIGYGGSPFPAKNIRVQPAKLQTPDKATVKVLFDFNRKNTATIYTLIREDGQWKIDDISPKGDGEGDFDVGKESTLELSDSIKTDMQNNYRAAEERYKQEQAKKH